MKNHETVVTISAEPYVRYYEDDMFMSNMTAKFAKNRINDVRH